MLKGCGLKSHPDKTVLCSSTVEFLGHNVSEHGLTPDEAKVAAIKALHPPTNLAQLRGVLGFIGYYRCYIPHFSKIANPLNGLLKKGAPFVWDAEQQIAFDTLKAEVSTPGRVLKHQDPNRPLILHTDWSKEGIGAILGQIDEQGNEYMIACISRSLNVHEKNYSSPHGEMLAAAWAVKTFHTYLHGTHFTLVTDHQPLTYLMTKNDLVSMLACWAITLQQYDFTVVHRPGEQHQNADCLSRMPQNTTVDTSGARLHEESDQPVRCSLAVHLAALESAIDNGNPHSLYKLPATAPFAEFFIPPGDDLITNELDCPLSPSNLGIM